MDRSKATAVGKRRNCVTAVSPIFRGLPEWPSNACRRAIRTRQKVNGIRMWKGNANLAAANEGIVVFEWGGAIAPWGMAIGWKGRIEGCFNRFSLGRTDNFTRFLFGEVFLANLKWFHARINVWSIYILTLNIYPWTKIIDMNIIKITIKYCYNNVLFSSIVYYFYFSSSYSSASLFLSLFSLYFHVQFLNEIISLFNSEKFILN